MAMDKHGNTFAPGDKVTAARAHNEKRAGMTGKVMDADPDMGTARVEWGPGDVTIEDVDKLERHP